MRPRSPAVPLAIGLAFVLALSGCLSAAVPPPASLVAATASPAVDPAASSIAPAPTATPAASSSASADPSAAPPSAPVPSPGPSASAPPGVTPTDSFAVTPVVAGHLQAAIDEFRAAGRIPGIAVTIAFPDGSTWTGVSGHADVAGKVLVTPDTAFSVASVTKTFVAALALELSGEGAFGLEDQVGPLLPELKLAPGITVRMLLDHTSGLHDYFLHPRIDRALIAAPSRYWSPSETLGYVAKPYFAPGAGWRYSNTNYLILGLLVERITGRPVAEELRARFLGPLDLRTTFYQSVEKPRGPLAHGYRLTGGGSKTLATDLSDGSGVVPFKAVVTASAAAGSVAASSRDLARWARALYGGEAIDPESLSIMLSGVERVASYEPRVPYGLGVQAIMVEGHRTFGHSGRFAGFRATMRWLPDEAVAIAVLTNQSRTDPGSLAARLLAIALPEPGRVPAGRPS